MSRFTTFLLFTIAVAMVAAQPRRVHMNNREKLTWWTDSKAHILSSKSFENLIGKDKHALVQFCATFAAECEQLAPEYNKLAETYNAPGAHSEVFVAKIDGWTFNSLSQTYDVTTFPDIRFIPKGNATHSEEYEGEMNAQKIAEWLEATVKKYNEGHDGKPAEEKKPEENKAPEPPKEAPKETNQAAQNNAQAQTPPPTQTQNQAPPKPVEEREVKIVLNTSLLQSQFEEVQARLNKLQGEFEHSIVENFKKVETLNQALESSKKEYQVLVQTVLQHGDKVQQVLNTLGGHKEDIKSSITKHAEDHLNTLKDSVGHIKNKVFEVKPEEPKGPGFTHNLIYMVIGSAVGGVIAYLAASSGSKKRRSMLD